MESSPVTLSADDFDLLDSSSIFDSFDQDMLGLDPSPMMHFDKADPSLENSEKWDASGNMFATWNSESDQIRSEDVDLSHNETQLCGTAVENSLRLQESKGAVSKGFTNLASTPKKRKGSGVSNGEMGMNRSSSSMNHVLEPSDSSENSDAFEDFDEVGKDGKNPSSKNLVSERRRRRKLNERLYTLRALVPKISRMDKASIVSDAISYLRELQKQVEQIEADIIGLELCKDCPEQARYRGSKDGLQTANIVHEKPLKEHRIVELEVSQMEEHTYHLRILCKKAPGALVQLTKALEALDLEIVNANLTSVNDNIINNIVVKAKPGEFVAAEELKRLTQDVVPKFGLIHG